LILGLQAMEKKVKREINYRIYLKAEFKNKISRHDGFLQEILKDKYVLLKGKIGGI